MPLQLLTFFGCEKVLKNPLKTAVTLLMPYIIMQFGPVNQNAKILSDVILLCTFTLF